MAALRDVVIVIDWAYINGGSAQIALSSAMALARSGSQVTVFAAVGPPMAELLATPNLRVVLTEQHEILKDPSRLRAAAQGIWNFNAARNLRKLLDDLNPANTVVHFHGWSKALSASVIKVAIKKRFPAVVTLHDYFAACPNGSLYNHQRHQICAITPMSKTCMFEHCDSRSYRDKVWRVTRTGVQRYVASMPSGIRDFITLSDLSEKLLAPALPKSARIHRVSNPINAERREAIDVAANAQYTYVGRLSREKGAVLFARAANEAGVPAVFVGDGECAADVRESNPNAEITGWLGRDGVRARLEGSRALVFPSLWYEVAPLVISEAAALGIPAIVPDTNAAREFVIDKISGLHFTGGNLNSLATTLERLGDHSLVLRLGRAAYESYWASPREMSQHLAGLCDVYERVLADTA